MAGGDKPSVLASLGRRAGNQAAGPNRVPEECGDIGLKIARDGTWFYQGSPIGRKPLVKLFASVLRREHDGGFYLVTPAERVSIEVEDAPFIAVAMERRGQGREQSLVFRTNVDDEVEAGLDHPLSFRGEADGSFTPFLMVRDGLQARLARPVYYDLVTVAADGEKSALGVWSAGTFFPFPATPKPPAA